MTKITGYTALATALTDDLVPIVDVHDTTMAATGTTKKITLANLAGAILDETATDIQPNGAQSDGSTELCADAGHIHPATGWVPADNGLLAANTPLPSVGNTQTTGAGNLYLLKVWIRQPFTATTLWLQCSTLGVGVSTHSFCGIWQGQTVGPVNAGTLLTSSSDIGANFVSPATTGPISSTWTTPQALTVAMGFVWVGFVFNLATTQPTLRSLGSNSATVMNTNLAAAQYAVAINGTSVTSLASITPSANSQVSAATAFWAGIS